MIFRALSGRPLEEITLHQAMADGLSADDVRIHPDTLGYQADVAERHGNPQLAENLRRAAELTAIEDGRLLAVYEALRPSRSTREELETIAKELSAAGATRCAAFIREAATAYEKRGLLRESSRS